ncbi:hypothetical protein PHYNN_133 [Pantoea phage Phynn]|nr:hypothetical protein PHYNN_133 [Pantoea phage Phynn]
MLNITENISQVFDPSRVVIKDAAHLKDLLTALATRVSERLPLGVGTDIRRSGERSFCFSIVDDYTAEAVQQFDITLDNNNQARWAPIV